MAMKLQLQYSLPVLRIRFGEAVRTPEVIFELVENVDGRQQLRERRTCPLRELGFTETSPRASQLGVPDWVIDWVAGWVQGALGFDEVDDPALWLHLAKPYATLGAVPWERYLQPACDAAVLRLPDALPDSERLSSSFNVALCATSPATGDLSSTALLVPEVAMAMAQGVGMRLRLHGFCEPEAHERLRPQLAGLPSVRLYRPEVGGNELHSHGAPQNLWLGWIRRATAGQLLDAVHFVAHGSALGDDGAMLTTLSPDHEEREYAQAVQAGELRAFLTDVGALTAGFTAPADNNSPYGLLKLVDDLGALRAGPVFMHDAAAESRMRVLADAYELLSGAGPGRPPADPSVVLFAQPRQIASVRPQDALPDHRLQTLVASPAVLAHFAADDTPQWIAVAQRYINENETDLVRFRDAAKRQPPTRTQLAHYAGVEEALHKIRAIVDKHAEKSL